MTEEVTERKHKRGHIHHKFTVEEDQSLKEIIARYGTTDWSMIAAKMPKRNARQCRERWLNYLNPDLNTDEWTPDEDKRLLDLHSQLGCRWVQITRAFPNRTDTMIKNRFNMLQRRKQREQPQEQEDSDMWVMDECFETDFPVPTIM